MSYDKRIIVYFVLLFLSIVLAWVALGYLFGELEAKKGIGSPYTLSQCFVEGKNIPFIPSVYTNGSLIEEMIACESSGNPNALGDNGKAKGILQFWDTTFEMYCVKKYGYRNDIWSEEIQRSCASEMLRDGLGKHWTCFPS